MSGRDPGEIWDASTAEGERRVDRSLAGQVSTGFVGGIMTLLTGLAHAAHEGTAKIAIALLVGFVLAAPSLNHAVVSVER